jgi:hypothetical protein
VHGTPPARSTTWSAPWVWTPGSPRARPPGPAPSWTLGGCLPQPAAAAPRLRVGVRGRHLPQGQGGQPGGGAGGGDRHLGSLPTAAARCSAARSATARTAPSGRRSCARSRLGARWGAAGRRRRPHRPQGGHRRGPGRGLLAALPGPLPPQTPWPGCPRPPPRSPPPSSPGSRPWRGQGDLAALRHFPVAHWRKLWSTDERCKAGVALSAGWEGVSLLGGRGRPRSEAQGRGAGSPAAQLAP